MNKLKILLLIASLLCVFFAESYGQYPKLCTAHVTDLVIPWNQNSISGSFGLTYSNNTCPYAQQITYVNASGPAWHTDGYYPPNSALPTAVNYTISVAGSYAVYTSIGWYDNNNNWCHGDDGGPFRFVVTKQAEPATHGNLSASAGVNLGPGTSFVEKTSSYVSSGSIISWSIIASALDMSGMGVDVGGGVNAINAVFGSEVGQLELRFSGNYVQRNGSINDTYYPPTGGYMNIFSYARIYGSGAGGAYTTITW